jgi:MoaA/NifB/PqqE/SkfB family radical SAM enzyme
MMSTPAGANVPTGAAPGRRPKVDIIWNITRVCMWDCANCCVDAVHVAGRRDTITIRSEGLQRRDQLTRVRDGLTIYDQAQHWLQQDGRELPLAGKLRVLDHLSGFDPKIDFSGGDPLSTRQTLDIMREAARRFHPSRITLTATGAGLSRYDPAEIIPLIGELNFTYDNVSKKGNAHRPGGYANGNLSWARKFARAGVGTRAECPLSAHNQAPATLRQLYLDLHEAGIDKLLLMRLFPVGRGELVASDIPTVDQYRSAIDLLRSLEERYGRPKLKLQCALRFFDSQTQTENPCDLVRESFGLMADGTLLASPWAVNSVGRPLHESWVLGNLAQQHLADILATAKGQEYARRLDENFGHCKIFSFLNGRSERPMDRLFEHADPLYTSAGSREEVPVGPIHALVRQR